MSEYVAVAHSRFTKAQRDIFTRKVSADCMSHQCRMLEEGNRLRLDACCQYGADVDIAEREAILKRRTKIAAVLRGKAKRLPWFGTDEYEDPEYPSGVYVRTATYDDGKGEGCIFLAHDQRGCGIHRAALENSWPVSSVKPHVCRLYPLSYESNAIVISDDYPYYSCSLDPDAPSLYRVARTQVAEVFGEDLALALDRAESAALSSKRRFRVIG